MGRIMTDQKQEKLGEMQGGNLAEGMKPCSATAPVNTPAPPSCLQKSFVECSVDQWEGHVFTVNQFYTLDLV